MATAARQILGKIKCPACTELVPVKQQSNGMACHSCPWCGYLGQAHQAEADKFIRAQVVPLKPGEAPPGEKPKPSAGGGGAAELEHEEEVAEELTIFDRVGLTTPTRRRREVKK